MRVCEGERGCEGVRVCVEDVSVLSMWVCDRGPDRIMVKISQSHRGDGDFAVQRDLEIPCGIAIFYCGTTTFSPLIIFHVHTRTRTNINAYICIYVYMYIYTYMHTYIYRYVCI